MNKDAEVVDRVGRMNPIPDPKTVDESLLAALASLVEEGRSEAIRTRPQSSKKGPGVRGRSVVALASALVVVLLTIGVIAILPGGGGTDVVVKPVPSGESSLSGIQGVEASAEFLWAWGDKIWRYHDGAWSPYSARPSIDGGDPDVAYAGDTRWMLNDSAVFSFDGEELVELTAAPPDVWSLAGDPGSGTLWLSTGEDLYRWDGEDMTNVGHPPNWLGSDWGYVGEIVATEDGSVWAAGLFAWVPENGGLARYDNTTNSWETVRPLGGDEDVPAWSLAASRDGDLWVTLSKWSQDWGDPTAPLPQWALVHLDGATGEWTVYDKDLPEGFPLVMAADNDAVWLTAGGSVGDFEPIAGVLRFDGQTWTRYLWDTDVTDTFDDIAAAPDGTIWYTQNGSLYQLDP